MEVFQRYEYKYLLTRSQQAQILRAMAPYMEPERYFHSSIRNLYYDTPDFRLIRESLSQPLYKEKLRLRSYGPAGPDGEVFAELKKKYDGIVFKRRVSMPRDHALAGLAGTIPLPDCQIGREIGYALQRWQDLAPAVFLSYERDAYRTPEGDFRLTFDDSILWRRDCLSLDAECFGDPILPRDTVLMELKLQGAMPLWMARELSRQGIRRTGFSKYGEAYTQILRMKGTKRYA